MPSTHMVPSITTVPIEGEMEAFVEVDSPFGIPVDEILGVTFVSECEEVVEIRVGRGGRER
nr:hypothetical protein Iba_chr12fCG5600 [Ipomoea batatas]